MPRIAQPSRRNRLRPTLEILAERAVPRTLVDLRLYGGSAPNLTDYSATAKTLAGLAPVFDLDSGGDVTVKMNYRLNPGSGGGDVTVLIPDSVFAGRSATDYVYLYSQFGGTWGANAGFEEWAVRTGPVVPP